ncbi:MAG: hypothetical protein Q4E54_06760 [Lachnospiraceae bacterium]|nr:hypothetical protein [Lachnospiraceae bacterium]MDO4939644.1 hypothetical protein [Lachnospiraceae bacterium]
MQEQIVNSIKFYPLDTLKALGYSQYKINQMVDAGKLEKINKKTYENLEFNGDDSDFYYAYAYVPDGVICLMSAAVYYNLTTFRPDSIDVAIPRKAKVSTLPEWPNIKLHYYTDYRYEKGVQVINNNGNKFRIYDPEKTVCDIVFYRDNVGIEETKEILKNYLDSRRRDLNKLIRYAENLKCGDILKTYLEVLV